METLDGGFESCRGVFTEGGRSWFIAPVLGTGTVVLYRREFESRRLRFSECFGFHKLFF